MRGKKMVRQNKGDDKSNV